jgi:hypothetical protein
MYEGDATVLSFLSREGKGGFKYGLSRGWYEGGRAGKDKAGRGRPALIDRSCKIAL